MTTPGFFAELSVSTPTRRANTWTEREPLGPQWEIVAQVIKVPSTDAECARRGLCRDQFGRCVSCGGGGDGGCSPLQWLYCAPWNSFCTGFCAQGTDKAACFNSCMAAVGCRNCTEGFSISSNSPEG